MFFLIAAHVYKIVIDISCLHCELSTLYEEKILIEVQRNFKPACLTIVNNVAQSIITKLLFCFNVKNYVMLCHTINII